MIDITLFYGVLLYYTSQIFHFFYKAPHQQKDFNSLKAQMIIGIFNNIVFFKIKVCMLGFFRHNAIGQELNLQYFRNMLIHIISFHSLHIWEQFSTSYKNISVH